MIDVYQNLAKHLDKLPGGYPATKSGVELRILKRLFSPEEAELALCLHMVPEAPEAIAARTGLNIETIAQKLEAMSYKGLIYRTGKKERRVYSAAMFIMGIWEYHRNDLTEDLVRDFNDYLPQIHLKSWMKSKTNHKRIIPVSAKIFPDLSIFSYDDAEALIKTQKKIVLGTCICLFLKNIKDMDKPGEYVHTNYYAQVDEEKCIACGACSDRCHMDAITVDQSAFVNSDRCIGCGVCVVDCPTDAICYKQKEKSDQYIPPTNIYETLMNMAVERGKA